MTAQLAGIAILAGGQSTRMGEDKALLAANPRADAPTLLDMHLRSAVALAGTTEATAMLCAGATQYDLTTYPQVQLVKDYVDSNGLDNLGPLAGMATALQSVHGTDPNAWLLVVSVDTGITAQSLFDLLSDALADEKIAEHDCVMLKDEQGAYPLLAMYRTHLLERLTSYLDAGDRKVMRFVDDINSIGIALPQQWELAVNFNTPQDYRQWLQQQTSSATTPPSQLN